ALSGWVDKTYGGFNAEFYEDLYVLMLRMKANYLWPAMWGKAFALDDPDNHATAHELGIVIGTSHHEPMLCSQEEWHRTGGTSEDWNYEDEEDIERLHAFWREGAKRAIEYETIVTVGMRGDGDEALTSDPNVGVLEGIVSDQRAILEEVTGRPAAETPQLWALYKEVLDYWDEGMEVPEDITMMFADDNWGNVRRLPLLGSQPRAGGY